MSPLSGPEMAALIAQARHQIDAVTPDIPHGMTRTEVAELVIGVGMAMCARMLRATSPLGPGQREQVAGMLDQAAGQLGVPVTEIGR